MKVFHFDPVSGKRGPFIENAPYAHQLSNPRPVCFCTGEFTAGTDTAWHWHVLMPTNA